MTDYETGIRGVTASDEEGAERLTEAYPFALLGDALTMLAIATSGNPIPEELAGKVGQIESDAEHITGNVIADTPLGANQLAAAAVAETVMSNLRRLGYITAG